MSTPRQLVNAALHSALRLSPDDLRLLIEVLRRIAAGAPLEHALMQVTGDSDVPAHWKS